MMRLERIMYNSNLLQYTSNDNDTVCISLSHRRVIIQLYDHDCNLRHCSPLKMQAAKMLLFILTAKLFIFNYARIEYYNIPILNGFGLRLLNNFIFCKIYFISVPTLYMAYILPLKIYDDISICICLLLVITMVHSHNVESTL